ncbi:hypothetical protein A7E78_00320 [Syntrophotalea acetylenivorans]|uniref:N-acetyltransferase domain-containing protein n=2 Tax=Syntrophotalea acetylenivorans TaxID=1842532 RepID=A0A1L3GKJ5_9BACT|nr:hypothetical protein A7E78_00320 [Syntrophotalea acetylenivorans]
MQSMGEPAGLVESRLKNGDEVFGWLDGDRIVCFGWVTYRKRALGLVRFQDKHGRVFLYNFHTSEDYRGRGLYPALLIKIRQVLGCDLGAEFIIDVNSKNLKSIRGIEKAGFAPVAQLFFLVLFNCWRWSFRIKTIDHSSRDLFQI